MCLGPEASAVTNGRFTSCCCVVESSIFAFSAASFRRPSAWMSFERSMPWCLELVDEPGDDQLVEVVAAQVRRRSSTSRTSLADLQDRMSNAAAQVVDSDDLLRLVQP